MSARRWSLYTLGSFLVALAVVGSAGLLHSAPPQQQVPGSLQPGTIAPGATAVYVANQPTVQAQQAGEWRVSVPGGVTLAGGGTMSFETPAFLEPGKRYAISWGSGLNGVYTIERLSKGWALARTGQSRVWINTALAVLVEETR